MQVEFINSGIVAFYHIQSKGPQFQDELKMQSKIESTSEAKLEKVKGLFEEAAKEINNSHLKSEWKSSNRELRSTFYKSISDATDISEKEIQDKISHFVKENSQRVLTMAREVAEKTRWSIDNIKSEEILGLIGDTKMSLFSSLFDQPMAKSRHIANFVIAEIAAEIFKINIHLHDVMIHIDRASNSGSIYEQISMKVVASPDKPIINLLQAWAMVHSGILEKGFELNHYHIAPQELVENDPNNDK